MISSNKKVEICSLNESGVKLYLRLYDRKGILYVKGWDKTIKPTTKLSIKPFNKFDNIPIIKSSMFSG